MNKGRSGMARRIRQSWKDRPTRLHPGIEGCPALRAAGPGSQQPTWEGGEAAGQGVGLVLWPEPLLQLGLQGVELAVAAVDEVLGSSFRLHLDDKNLGKSEVKGQPQRPGAAAKRRGVGR